jgi:hypothetical protein
MTAKPAFEKLKDSVAALPAPSPALTKFVDDYQKMSDEATELLLKGQALERELRGYGKP